MSTNPIHIITDLILSNTAYGQDETIAILSADSVDLIEAIADVAKAVHVYDLSHRAVSRLRHYVRLGNVQFFDTVHPSPAQRYDAVIIFVPKGRDYGRGLLWAAMQTLVQGGTLYIAGPTKGGAKTLISDAAQLFGDCNTLAYKKSHRVAASIKTSQNDYPGEWGADPTQMQQFEAETPFGALIVATMPGVFSWQALDAGTRFLLENTTLRGSRSVLDVGCGNGIMGTALASQVERVMMVDDNLLALRCAEATAELNQQDAVMVLPGDVYNSVAGQQFDLIISNPPFHKKFDVNMTATNRIIQEAPEHLNTGGRLLLVANAFLRYEPLFEAAFAGYEVIARNNKFKVIEGVVA